MSTTPFISTEKMTQIHSIIENTFKITDYLVDWGAEIVRFRVTIPKEQETLIPELFKQIRGLGFLAVVRPYRDASGQLENEQYWLILGHDVQQEKKKIHWNVALFIATIATVTWAGYSFSTSPLFVEYYEITNPWPTAFLFMAGLMGIVGTHELGHMLAAHYNGMKPALPYFLPIPPVAEIFGILSIGTIGAVIKQDEPFSTKNSLFDIGIAGPLLGLLTTIIVTMFGYALSIELPYTPQEFLALHPTATALPSPILYDLIGALFTSNSGNVMLVHPVAFAGWVGFLLTAIQLLPASQLDGGHVAYASLGRKKHKYATYLTVAVLLLLQIWTMALLLLLLSSGQAHPETLDSVTPLSLGRKVIAVFVIPLIIITFPPLYLLLI